MSNNNFEVGRVYSTSSGGEFHVGGTLPPTVVKAAQEEMAQNSIFKHIHGATSTHDSRMQTFEDWLLDAIKSKKVLRLWEYRRMFTPYEQQKAFSDESQYISTHAKLIRLVGGVTLPDGDIMLSYEIADDDEANPKYYDFVKLSEIKLAYAEQDQDDYMEEAE